MGTIIETQVMPNNMMKVKLQMDYEESLFLEGRYRNIHIFSEEDSDQVAQMVEKGKNGAAKYLEIPKSLRQKPLKRLKNVRHQVIDTPSKLIFICIADHPFAQNDLL